jgi:hypothetical protein
MLLMLQLSLVSCAHSGTQVASHEIPQPTHALGPGRTLSLCEFGLRGAAGGNTTVFFGIIGAFNDEYKRQKDMPYAYELREEFIRVYEDTLKSVGIFPYLPMQKLAPLQNGKALPLDIMAKENDLHACLAARSDLMIKVGWSKKVEVWTAWEITGQPGWKLTIETSAVSKEGQGLSPNPADPKMKPVFLQLARESVSQFLEKLAAQDMLPGRSK